MAFIGTTDDPIDSLEWHEKIKNDPTIKFTVAPSFRPDMAINIIKPGFAEYMDKLAASVGKDKLACIHCVMDALTERLEFFVKMGCRAADHGLDYVPYREATVDEVDAIYKKPWRRGRHHRGGRELPDLHPDPPGRLYHKHGVAMQLHYSCLRGVNRKMNALLGPTPALT